MLNVMGEANSRQFSRTEPEGCLKEMEQQATSGLKFWGDLLGVGFD